MDNHYTLSWHIDQQHTGRNHLIAPGFHYPDYVYLRTSIGSVFAVIR